ncbi:hemolysin D [Candidatus Tenderia electrophaga]|jgi:Cu(I)/Ag(I) efflux system membrane fusion protein|uniref:Hemolysin D n=1 Tax=Candidatus Tenderia electrophaga TaxID=1748243 RepID=A0A0S2TAW8_9GAMM|nr:hemolysin D [Candidatus Tenderia electrophaga]
MNKTVIMVALAALGLGAAGGYLLNERLGAPASAKHEATSGQREVLFWRNPMNPEITSPVFTQDEMGMDYIPVYAGGDDAADTPAGTVSIDPTVVQNIGVRTAVVEQRPLARRIHALGHVDFNEERLARLHPKTSGWIEQLRIEETGTAVKQDTILLSIYAPDLVAAQQEYLVALSNWEALRNSGATAVKNSAKRVLQSARQRLELFDVPAHQIHELEQSRELMRNLHIHSPFAGRVMNIGAREGQYVTPQDELYLIADLSRIWVSVDVYEDDLPWIELGDRAELEVRAAPGEVYEGEVSFIHPVQDRQTRTVRVRLAVDNPDLTLKPGMFANVVLHADPRPDAVVVPSEAIVRSGQREQVFVARGEGKFIPRDVQLGISAGGETQILSGVEPGERVVVSSQFLIDSESKLKEATAKMMAPEPVDHGMSMEGMEMDDMSMDDMDMSEMGE